ncbi:MAG TPA: hypothetical protein VH497_09205 [Vicinamibacterales bacterium]
MRSDSASAVLAMVCASLVAEGCAYFGTSPNRTRLTTPEREAAIARAQLWTKTDVAAMDLRAGPQGPGAFAPGQTVVCDYVDETAGGHSPKFTCAIGGHDKVKVKFGRDNGEPFAEVAASRLLWALGFGADHEYPVRVVCRGCPGQLLGFANDPAEMLFEFAAIERKQTGHEIEGPEGRGWAWFELDWVDPSAGGATRAERDALKLLAVVLQHTDNKRDQQRIVCLDRAARRESRETCRHTFMLINDLGETFGHAGTLNLNATASVNLAAWEQTPVWAKSEGCVGNLPQSWSGTLNNPRITEEGRTFLASLLTQLTDRQLLDLFEVARFSSRTHDGKAPDYDASPAAWVRAFKSKVDQITGRSCAPAKADDER